MRLQYHYLLSLCLVCTAGFWYFFPVPFGAITPLRSFQIIVTAIFLLLWIKSFSSHASFQPNRSTAQIRKRRAQTPILVIALLITGAVIYLL